MCELGCSTGYVSRSLAKQFPKSTFYGYDIAEDAIDFANKQAALEGQSNVKFFVQDCCNMPEEWTGKWEYILALDLVHDVPSTTSVLREICRVLKPGCIASIIDIDMHSNIEDNRNSPMAAFIYSISLAHCMTVSLAEGGQGLGAAWGREKAIEMIKEAGFTSVEPLSTPNDKLLVHYLCSH